MASSLLRRDLDAELQKHFWGTPEDRMRAALRLGDEAVELYRSGLAPGTTHGEAREAMRRMKANGQDRRGRRPHP
jgi:hypothetical protein